MNLSITMYAVLRVLHAVPLGFNDFRISWAADPYRTGTMWIQIESFNGGETLLGKSWLLDHVSKVWGVQVRRNKIEGTESVLEVLFFKFHFLWDKFCQRRTRQTFDS